METSFQNLEIARLPSGDLRAVWKMSKSVWITLEYKINQVVLTIRDHGVGFAKANAPRTGCGFRMTTMRERAQRIGTWLAAKCPANGGTAIRVVVPLAEDGETLNHQIK